MTNGLLKFHWSLSQAGNSFRRAENTKLMSGLIRFDDQLNLCLKAEENGIDSMLMAIGFTRPDPLLLSVALGQATEKIKFMVAVRSGLISPAYYVQQLNTASAILGDRIHINVVSGHTPAELKYYGDFLSHDERYARSGEFIEVCRLFWRNDGPVNFNGNFYHVENGIIKTPFNSPAGRPDIYIGGNSEQSANMVVEHGDCLWRFPDTPDVIRAKIGSVIAAGKQAGFIASIIARPTQAEAEDAAMQLLHNFSGRNTSAQEDFYRNSDSEGFKTILEKAFAHQSAWITPYLWNGAVPYLGAPSIAFVGSYENIAGVIMDYKEIGVTQYLFMGWPDEEEIVHFGQGVLPLIRKMEQDVKGNKKVETKEILSGNE